MEILRVLRCNMGWSLNDLAKKLDGIVTRQALHKYESGEAHPSRSVVLQLARVFGITPLELLEGVDFTVTVSAFRKRKALATTEEKRIREQFINETRKRVMALVRLEGRQPKHNSLEKYADKPAETTAAELRSAWGLGEAPIPNLTACMEDHGIHVILLATKDGFDGICAEVIGKDGQRYGSAIGIREREHGGRTRFTLAHELGHLVLDTKDETEVNEFAGALLAPRTIMERRLGVKRNRIKREELDDLSKELGVSPDAIVRRAYDLNIINKESYTFWNQILLRHGAPKSDDIPVEKSQLLKRLVLRGLAERLLTKSEARDWLGEEQFATLPVNEGPSTSWELKKMTKEQRLELLSQAAEVAEAYYNGEEADLVDGATEVYEDSGIP